MMNALDWNKLTLGQIGNKAQILKGLDCKISMRFYTFSRTCSQEKFNQPSSNLDGKRPQLSKYSFHDFSENPRRRCKTLRKTGVLIVNTHKYESKKPMEKRMNSNSMIGISKINRNKEITSRDERHYGPKAIHTESYFLMKRFSSERSIYITKTHQEYIWGQGKYEIKLII